MALLKQLALAQFVPNPGAPAVTNVGTPGGTSYGYAIVSEDASGAKTAVGSTGSTATGNATLNGSNFNRVTIVAPAGSVKHYVYRISGGATQGLIGSTTGTSFDDTGLVGDGTTAPTTNKTGIGTAQDMTGYGNLTAQLSNGAATPDFVATVVIEGSLDQLEWVTVMTLNAGTRAGAAAAGTYYPYVRAHMTAYTSGLSTMKAYAAGLAR